MVRELRRQREQDRRQGRIEHPLIAEWFRCLDSREAAGESRICAFPIIHALFRSQSHFAGMDDQSTISRLMSEIRANTFRNPPSPIYRWIPQYRRRQCPGGNSPTAVVRKIEDAISPNVLGSVPPWMGALRKGDVALLSDDPDWIRLDAQERLFVYHYFISGFDAAKAMEYAYPDFEPSGDVSMAAMGKIVAGKRSVLKGVRVLVDYFLSERKNVLAKTILDVLEAQAFYDVADIINDDGELVRPLAEMTREQRLAIKGVERKYFGKDADVETTVVTLVDRQAALDKLAKFVQLFIETPPPQNKNEVHLHVASPIKTNLRTIFDNAAGSMLANFTEVYAEKPHEVELGDTAPEIEQEGQVLQDPDNEE